MANSDQQNIQENQANQNELLRIVDHFKCHQPNPSNDNLLFSCHLIKCRLCFRELDDAANPSVVNSWHRTTFQAATGAELSCYDDLTDMICSDCDEVLKYFDELREAADEMKNLQSRYSEHIQEHNIIQQRVEDDGKSDANSDCEIISWSDDDSRNDQQKQIGDDSDTRDFMEFLDSLMGEDHSAHPEPSAGDIKSMPECSVRVERLDDATVKKYTKTSNNKVRQQANLTVEKRISKVNYDEDGEQDDDDSNEHINYLKEQLNISHTETCHQCGEIVSNKKSLRNHLRLVHTDRYMCHKCCKTFGRMEVFDDHMSTYHMNMKAEFKCTRCPKIYKSQEKLRDHQNKVHYKRKFKCDKCDASSFLSSRRLKEHVQVRHEGKRVKCSYPGCTSQFTSIDNAMKHLRDVHKFKKDDDNLLCLLYEIV